MYETYWNFQRRPFGAGCDPATYYPSDAHQGTLLKLRYVVESRGGAALLAGKSGTGKTTVARVLAERLGDGVGPILHLTFPQLPTADLLAYTAHRLNATFAADGRAPTVDESLRVVERCLTENAANGRHAVLVVDEAHLLESPRTLETLRLLLNFEHEGRPALTILFVGQPSLLPIVERLPQLEQRLVVKCLVRTLQRDETHTYVRHRLSAAGGTATIFSAAALDALHDAAQGVPRDVNRLCDLALLLGYADEVRTIDADRVEAVLHELVAPTVDA